MTYKAEKAQPWSPEKKLHWFLKQREHRSYKTDVLSRLDALRKLNRPQQEIVEYGRLTINPEKFPLYAIQLGDPAKSKANILLSGGVHGYETSGVKGALLFLEKHADEYLEFFHFIITPCISPWSYETINRLNPVMENPNREFKSESKSEESRLLMTYLGGLGFEFDAHIDLHETTDSDLQFLPEEYAKNGLKLDPKDMFTPDGFYLIGIENSRRPELETAMIEAVRKVTHIAEPDAKRQILGSTISQEGVIHNRIPGLFAEYTSANTRLGAYTTEMYPDSPKFKSLGPERTEAICNEAQVACVKAALDFWKKFV